MTETIKQEKRGTTTVKEKKKSVWADVPRRLATICIGVPIVWKLLERPITAYIFFFGAHALSAWEYSLLEPAISSVAADGNSPQTQQQPQKISNRKRFVFCVSSLLLAAIPDSSASLFSFAVSLAAGIFAVANRHHWMVGLLVVTIPFRSWCNLACEFHQDGAIASDPSSFASIVAVLLTVWNADTGALLAGRLLGRRKKKSKTATSMNQKDDSNPLPLWIRRISPAKTMEGFLGGILGGIGTAIWAVPPLLRVFSLDTSPGFRLLWGLDGDSSIINRFYLGLCLSILAILGDLVESSIKRRSHSKDSGSVLPGHGGILDRFDSSLLAVLFYRFALEQATAIVSSGGDYVQDENRAGHVDL